MKSSLAPSPQPLAPQLRQQLKIVIVGHIDHGKSTLIGRLFHDTGSLPDGKLEHITATCKKRGMAFEWAFLMDALQAERDQNITIDTTQIWFKTAKRDYCIVDAPGHREFLKNMVTGAAGSEAALLLVDVEEGMREQTRRHAYLLHLLGVRQVAVLVNKMDRANYDQKKYDAVVADCAKYLKEIGVTPSVFIPISAREGDMLVNRGDKMKWYSGPSVVEALDHFTALPSAVEQPLRFPVQDVYRFDDRRIIAGRIESGKLKAGDTVLLSPTNLSVKVKSIETFPESKKTEALAGESVGVTFEDQFFVERGHVISHDTNAPMLSNQFRGRVFWLGHAPLVPGKRYKLRIATAEYPVEVKKIERIIDTDSLAPKESAEVGRNQVAEVLLQVRGLAVIDDYATHPTTGRFVLIDGYDIMGGGNIDTTGFSDQRVAKKEVKAKNIVTVESDIAPAERAALNGHAGGILWFTGLSGSGKSTLAKELSRRLFEKGYQVYVLDGDNVRQGLCADLGFSPQERTENIRRVGEVAALFARAGVIVITAFISPYAEDRRRARAAAPEHFHSIYIKADVKTCECRDVKGLYKKARKGEIKEFTGVSAPYEEPENPELVIDTMKDGVDACVEQLIGYVKRQFVDTVDVGSWEI